MVIGIILPSLLRFFQEVRQIIGNGGKALGLGYEYPLGRVAPCGGFTLVTGQFGLGVGGGLKAGIGDRADTGLRIVTRRAIH